MKIVVITGSTRGIGFGLAGAFLDLGCAVVISGRNPDTLQKAQADLAARYGSDRLLACTCDVIDYTQIQALWNAAVARFGRVDVWINNAGIAHPIADLWELPVDNIRAVIETNMLGAIYGARVALIGMRAQGSGSIYNMEGLGSGGGRKVRGLALYGTTKAWLTSFTRSLAKENQGSGVQILGFSPGMMTTDMLTSPRVVGEKAKSQMKNFGFVLRFLAKPADEPARKLVEMIAGNAHGDRCVSNCIRDLRG